MPEENQNQNPAPQPVSETKKSEDWYPKKSFKFYLSLVPLLLFLLVLAGAYAYSIKQDWDYTNKTSSLAFENNERKHKARPVQTPQASAENEPVETVTDNSKGYLDGVVISNSKTQATYRFGSSLLTVHAFDNSGSYYMESFSGTATTTLVMFPNVRGDSPKFFKTSAAEIALLKVLYQDASPQKEENFFVTASSVPQRLLSVSLAAPVPALVIKTSTNTVLSELAFKSDLSRCTADASATAKAGFRGLTVNGKAVFTFAKSVSVPCASEGTWGDEYPTFQFVGISPDMSKIFFKTAGEDLVFNIKAKTIQRSEPKGMLQMEDVQ